MWRAISEAEYVKIENLRDIRSQLPAPRSCMHAGETGLQRNH